MSILDTTNQDDQPQIDENKNYLEELVGEGRKFKSPEELAKGKAYADAYIEIQNKRMDELREDYKKLRDEHMAGTSLKELIDQLKTQKQPESHEPPPVNNKDERPVFDPSQLDSLLDQKMVQRESFLKQQQNEQVAKAKLVERYGTNYHNTIKRQIDDLGMTVQEFDQMARSNPKLFERTFLPPVQTEGVDGLPRGTARPSDPFAPTMPKRDFNYYNDLRKKNPDLYYSPKIQVQMHEDAQRLGDAFGV